MDFIKDIIIFILSLSVLVVIHELGHFVTAKIFNVYCREFSIGMGPLLFKHKGKNAETQFSIRAIPLGGFVSMVGENAGDSELIGGQKDPDAKIEDNQEVVLSEEEVLIMNLPKERRLDGIAKWKRAIIMAAGVFMNLVLALFLFLGSNATIKTYDRSFSEIVEGGAVATQAPDISTSDVFVSGSVKYTLTFANSNDEKQEKTVTGSRDDVKFKDGKDLYKFIAFTINQDERKSLGIKDNEVLKVTKDNKLYYTLNTEEKTYKFTINAIKQEDDTYQFEKFGVSFHTRHLTFNEVIKYTFLDLGDSSVAIIKALGTLFTKEGIAQVGGPIAIFQLSSQATSMGFAYFCRLWGLISVNLAVMNFLPFPGLDGWHFLVLIVEGITRKEMPAKAKNIVSTIGLMLLFALMILITFKDVIGLFR